MHLRAQLDVQMHVHDMVAHVHVPISRCTCVSLRACVHAFLCLSINYMQRTFPASTSPNLRITGQIYAEDLYVCGLVTMDMSFLK